MTAVELCGFAAGDSLETEGITGTASIVASAGRDGGYAFRANPTTTAVGNVLLGGHDSTTGSVAASGWNISTAFARFYFKINTLPSADSEEFFQILDTAVALKLAGRVTSAGKLQLYQNDGTTQVGSDSTSTFTTGVWYKVNIRCNTGSSTTAVLTVDGTIECSSTTANLGTTNCGYIQLGKVTNRNGRTVSFDYDSLLVDDTAAPGSGICKRMVCDSNGNANTWSSSSGGNKWDDVNGEPVDPITYLISTTSSGDAQTLGLVSAATAGISGVVRACKLVFAGKRNGASNGAVRLRLRSATTNDDTSTDVAMGNPIVMKQRMYPLDPATSAAWTVSALDSVEVGAVNRSANASRMNYAALMVDFQAPSELAGFVAGSGATAAILTATGALAALTGAIGATTGSLSEQSSMSTFACGGSAATAVLTATGSANGFCASGGATSALAQAIKEAAGFAAGGSALYADGHGHADAIGLLGGQGSSAAALTARGALAGTVAGGGSGTAVLTGTGALSGFVAGSGSSTAALAGRGDLSALAAGGGAVASSLSGNGSLTGFAAGGGSTTALLLGNGALVGHAAGVSSLLGQTSLEGGMQATADGVAAAFGLLTGDGSIAASASGGSSASALLTASGALSGHAAGTGAALGTMTTEASLAGFAPGGSFASGVLVASGSMGGVVASLGSTTAALGGTGQMSGAAHGGSATTAALSGSGALAGHVAGDASTTASLDFAISSQTGFVAGDSAAFATLTADGQLVGAAIGGSAIYLQTVATKGFYEELNYQVTKRFHDLVETPNALITQYDNEDQEPATNDVWARVYFLPGTSMQADMGGESIRHRTPGVMVVALFSPLVRGVGPALAMADLIDDQFRTVTANGVTYRKPYVSVVGRERAWHRVNVTCPFYADDVA